MMDNVAELIDVVEAENCHRRLVDIRLCRGVAIARLLGEGEMESKMKREKVVGGSACYLAKSPGKNFRVEEIEECLL